MFTETPPELIDDLKLRWTRLRQELRRTGADALLIGTNANLFYLAGRVFMGYVYLPVEGEPWFFVKRPCGFVGENVADIRKPEHRFPNSWAAAGRARPKAVLFEGVRTDVRRMMDAADGGFRGRVRVERVRTGASVAARSRRLTKCAMRKCRQPPADDVIMRYATSTNPA
jgi:hypothetical protein